VTIILQFYKNRMME